VLKIVSEKPNAEINSHNEQNIQYVVWWEEIKCP
jgi:hypothetical protein